MKIGFIGLGTMGGPMCENIIKKHGDRVFVYDVEPEKSKRIAALGATECGSSLSIALQSDLIITMVPRSEHLRMVYKEILPAIDETKICVDMSTVDPAVSLETAAQVKARGGAFADCPVVKSKPAAIAGKLGIYVGCDEALFPTLLPVLSYMGENVKRMGEAGSGITMKICHNALVAQIQNGVNETLCLARRCGISVADFAEAISYGGGQNFYLDGQWKNIEAENWEPAFSLENMHKDLGICMKLSEQTGVAMPGAANAKAVYDRGMEAGLGKLDFRTTYKVVRGDEA